MAKKARYWVGIGWLENLRSDWKDVIDDTLGLPYCYCVHDKDVDKEGNPRKEHMHLMLMFSGPTTENNALYVMNMLSEEGKQAFNKVEQINGVRNKYNYLIHDTKKCREMGKHQYDPLERIEGNNFDIGIYEQLSQVEKDEMLEELIELIKVHECMDLLDLHDIVVTMPSDYKEVMRSNQSYLKNLCSGVYHRWKRSLLVPSVPNVDVETGEVYEA